MATEAQLSAWNTWKLEEGRALKARRAFLAEKKWWKAEPLRVAMMDAWAKAWTAHDAMLAAGGTGKMDKRAPERGAVLSRKP
jgi:hypothetical protein